MRTPANQPGSVPVGNALASMGGHVTGGEGDGGGQPHEGSGAGNGGAPDLATGDHHRSVRRAAEV